MRYTLYALILILTLSASTARSADMNNGPYSDLLRMYVKDGLVDYGGLAADREGLDTYLAQMSLVDPKALSRDSHMAFYINLYNAATLRLIVDHYPVQSIKNIGSFFSSPWKLKVVSLHGEMVTLDHIEHDIVRPQFNDPRVHFAFNCSALSCPELLGVPFVGTTLDSQLESAVKGYINDGKNNYLDGTTLYVSKIFSWFSDDFPDDFVSWFTGYAQGNLKKALEQLEAEGRRPQVRYLKYNWGLNKQGP